MAINTTPYLPGRKHRISTKQYKLMLASAQIRGIPQQVIRDEKGKVRCTVKPQHSGIRAIYNSPEW